MSFDVIVIGSGFGGSVTACRLAEAGRRVLVLERGRRWTRGNFPRKIDDPWLWSHSNPEARNGWLDLRSFSGMAVAQAAGVGGGSLIYANVSCEAPCAFDWGWPAGITYAGMKPHYGTVADVMGVQPVPGNQWSARMRLVKDAANAIGCGDRFKQLDLAVNFDADLPLAEVSGDPLSVALVPNKHGANQGHCVHCGNCVIGCDALAKNTLDLNYLYLAEKQHADVRELHLVDRIERLSTGGYRVGYDRLTPNGRVPGFDTANTVVVAAGSLGSTELLLRARDVHRTLPNISSCLGKGWSANGDFLTPAFYGTRDVGADQGPTIASAIDFQDKTRGERSFWIQDGGIPNLAVAYLTRKLDDPMIDPRLRALLLGIQHWFSKDDALNRVMPWFAQGVDAGNGTLLLNDDGVLDLSWDVAQSEPLIDSIVDMHKLLSRKTGGEALVPPTWSLFKDLITPHPLGGCRMGTTEDDGVVDFRGQVFNYPNLHVADGAVVPRPLGVNPSRTIGALAEHIAACIVEQTPRSLNT